MREIVGPQNASHGGADGRLPSPGPPAAAGAYESIDSEASEPDAKGSAGLGDFVRDDLVGDAAPGDDMTSLRHENKSDDDEQMFYSPTDPSESTCASSDSEKDATGESPPKRGTTAAESPSKRARMTAHALRHRIRPRCLQDFCGQQEPPA